MNKLDVIIPAYNAHKWIKDILKCLEKQTFKDSFLVTIVDDGSIKPYDDIIKNINLNIKIVKSNKNRGLIEARKLGLKNTNAPYFLFLDADDSITNDKMIEKMYNIINENKYKVVYAKELNENRCLHHDYHFSSKMLSREIVNKYKIKSHKYTMEEDVSFMMSYYSVITENEIYKIDELFYKYRHVNNNSITSKHKLLVKYDAKQLFSAINWAFKYAKKNNNYWLFKERMYGVFLFLSKSYFDNIKIANEEVTNSYLKRCKKFYNKYKFYIEYYRHNKCLNELDEEFYDKFKNVLEIL